MPVKIAAIAGLALALATAPLAAAAPPQPRLLPGMVAVDPNGTRVGVITRTDAVRDHRPAVEVLDSGVRFTVRLDEIRLSRRGETAVIELSPSEILTRAILNDD